MSCGAYLNSAWYKGELDKVSHLFTSVTEVLFSVAKGCLNGAHSPTLSWSLITFTVSFGIHSFPAMVTTKLTALPHQSAFRSFPNHVAYRLGVKWSHSAAPISLGDPWTVFYQAPSMRQSGSTLEWVYRPIFSKSHFILDSHETLLWWCFNSAE